MFQSKPAVAAFVIGAMAITVVLLLAGWFLGLALAPRLDRTSATLLNLILALAPAAIVVASGGRTTPIIPVAVVAMLLVVMLATLNLHAAVWLGPHLTAGSAARLIVALSALIWPVVAVGALGLAVRRRTGQSVPPATTLASQMLWLAVQLSLVWILIRLLSGAMPVALMFLIIIAASVLAQFVLESEVGLLMLRRAATPTPPAAAMAKAEVEVLTGVAVDGPLVVDRGSDMVAEIRWRVLGRPVLVLSSAMARLESAALSAVVAHEYAHASLGHLRMRLWLTLGTSIALIGAVALFMQATGLAGAPAPMMTFLVVTVALICQRLVMYAVVRRQERQADAFAASLVGADAMRAALEVTSSGPVLPSAFTPWMTHDSQDARRRALDRQAS